MELLIGIIIGVIVLILLVVVHELGHAIVAKRNGVEVREFGIGFPPIAYSKKVKQSFLGKNVQYSVNWLPLGGFVRLKGEYDSASGKGDYGAASYWVKTRILFAGVAVNWLVAALLLTVLAWTGLPKIVENQFTVSGDTRVEVTQASQVQVMGVQKNSAAERSGIRKGDSLIAINDQPVTSGVNVSESVKKFEGKSITITIDREGKKEQKIVHLSRNPDDGKSYLGVRMGEYQAREMIYATWSAPVVGVGTAVQLTVVTLQGLGDMVAKFATGLIDTLNTDEKIRQTGRQKIDQMSQGVAGPVGILGVIFPQAGQAGMTMVLFLAAIISLSLAVMNALPIPALDGGRWATMTWFRLRKKVLTREKEENIQATGMLLLLGLVILITVADVGKVLQ